MLKIYGASDDMVVIEGQMNDEVEAYDVVVQITFIDGTIAKVSYGKDDLGIWKIEMIATGDKFDRLEECYDEDAEIYSDILYMKGSQECLVSKIEEI